MFQYIQSDEDAKNLYITFKDVMEKYKNKGLSDEELFKIIENQYYIDYVMSEEVNKISYEDEGSYEESYDTYDGYDGYDN